MVNCIDIVANLDPAAVATLKRVVAEYVDKGAHDVANEATEVLVLALREIASEVTVFEVEAALHDPNPEEMRNRTITLIHGRIGQHDFTCDGLAPRQHEIEKRACRQYPDLVLNGNAKEFELMDELLSNPYPDKLVNVARQALAAAQSRLMAGSISAKVAPAACTSKPSSRRI